MKLLLLLAFVGLCYGTLSGSFCSAILGLPIVNEQGPSFPSISYVVDTICVTFEDDTSFILQAKGAVKDQNNPAPYSVEAHCTGRYFFGSDYQINLGYVQSTPSYCTQNTNLPGFCPWICTQFGGTWSTFFAPPLSAPMAMAIDPSSSNPDLNWGGLVQSFPMSCNSSSCGSASDLVPPAPIPANSVRFSQGIRDCMLHCHFGADACYDYCKRKAMSDA